MSKKPYQTLRFVIDDAAPEPSDDASIRTVNEDVAPGPNEGRHAELYADGNIVGIYDDLADLQNAFSALKRGTLVTVHFFSGSSEEAHLAN